jgi:hypothetical protein
MTEAHVTISGLAKRLGRTPELGEAGVLVVTWECTAEGRRRNAKAGTVTSRHLAITDVLELHEELPDELVVELRRQRREAEENDTGAPVIEGIEGWLDGSGVVATPADLGDDDDDDEDTELEDDDDTEERSLYNQLLAHPYPGDSSLVSEHRIDPDAEPWDGYAGHKVTEITKYLEDYARADEAFTTDDRSRFRRLLTHVRAFEQTHKARKTILDLVDTHLTAIPEAPAPNADGVDPAFEDEEDLEV